MTDLDEQQADRPPDSRLSHVPVPSERAVGILRGVLGMVVVVFVVWLVVHVLLLGRDNATLSTAVQQLADQVTQLGGEPVVNPSDLPAGPAGPAGGTGASGVQGPAGPVGASGPQGPQGLTGAAGKRGPRGFTGLDGPVGATGAQGPRGEVGPSGSTGSAGATGADGPAGAQGPKGDQGDPGPAGPTGDVGPAGPPGPTCPDGFHPETQTVVTTEHPLGTPAVICTSG